MEIGGVANAALQIRHRDGTSETLLVPHEALIHHIENNQAEQAMMNQAIEESKQANPNPDNMTYEEMISFEERQGKVSKGLPASEV